MDDCPKTEQSPARSGDAPQQPLAERKSEPFISTARVDHVLKEARRPIAIEMGVGVGTIHRMAQRRSKHESTFSMNGENRPLHSKPPCRGSMSEMAMFRQRRLSLR